MKIWTKSIFLRKMKTEKLEISLGGGVIMQGLFLRAPLRLTFIALLSRPEK